MECQCFFSDCKDQKKCDNAHITPYAHALGFVADCYKTQNMCKAVSTTQFAIHVVPG